MSDPNQAWHPLLDPPAHAIRPSDAASLGAPPRELDARMKKYVKDSYTSRGTVGWTAMAVLFLGVGGIVFAVMPSIATVPWLGVLFAALAVRAQRVTRRVRSEAAQVLREGALRMAYVADVRQEQLGRTPANAGLALHVAAAATKKHRYTIRFNIDGESVTMVTTNDGLSLLPVGTQIEVLYRPGSDHVVPTYLLM